VVADAEVDHHVAEIVVQRASDLSACPDVSGWAAVLVRDPVGEHAGSVGRLPPERRRGEAGLVRARPHEAVGVHALAAQDLRQHRVVAERVDVHADRRGDPELLLEVALGVKTLTREGLAGGHVAVRLHPPAADHLPPAVRDAFADAGEQLGVGLLHPGEQDDLVAGEDEVRDIRPCGGWPTRTSRGPPGSPPATATARPGRGGRSRSCAACGRASRPGGRRRPHWMVELRTARWQPAPPPRTPRSARGSSPAAQASTISLITCSISVCISWIRWVLFDGTSRSGRRGRSPGRRPAGEQQCRGTPRLGAERAATTLGERPEVVNATTTSSGPARASICRLKTSA
jgi:hypothetical protein